MKSKKGGVLYVMKLHTQLEKMQKTSFQSFILCKNFHKKSKVSSLKLALPYFITHQQSKIY